MRDTVIVYDAGSTWMGKMEYGYKLIDLAKEARADAIKFQLFEGQEFIDAGNIPLRYDQFEDFYKYGLTVGMPVAASVFNKTAFEFITSIPDMHHIKFAYSMRHSPLVRGAINLGKRTVVTTNIHDSVNLPNADNLIKLCTAPRCKHADEYAILSKMNFDGLFPNRFQGFSDHSLGYLEAQSAVQHKAHWIEKHISLGFSDTYDCPDGRFALRGEEA